MLELHAKTMFDNPKTGNDEYYILVDISKAGSGIGDHPIPGSARSTGWNQMVVTAWDMRSHPLYNWLSIAVTCSDFSDPAAGMKGAYMVMTMWLRYFFSPPKTCWSPDWSTQLYGTKYKVVKVTP
jgi:hypothetical protein